jgi:hypothetical protein
LVLCQPLARLNLRRPGGGHIARDCNGLQPRSLSRYFHWSSARPADGNFLCGKK